MRTAVLVVAKAPVPGQVKTRLAADLGAEAAAELASAALLDTLDVAERVAGPRDRMISLTGDLERACHGGQLQRRLAQWQVRAQRGATFAHRLVGAHHDAAQLWGRRRVVVQIGMDTPSLTTADLQALARVVGHQHDVGLGPAVDGGWWGLALRSAEYVDQLVDVPMSTAHTCRRTRIALAARGATVTEVHPMTDVDDLADAHVVSRQAPTSRFTRCFADVLGRRRLVGDESGSGGQS